MCNYRQSNRTGLRWTVLLPYPSMCVPEVGIPRLKAQNALNCDHIRMQLPNLSLNLPFEEGVKILTTKSTLP